MHNIFEKVQTPKRELSWIQVGAVPQTESARIEFSPCKTTPSLDVHLVNFLIFNNERPGLGSVVIA